jgi:DNA-binding response OmpR family regulator
VTSKEKGQMRLAILYLDDSDLSLEAVKDGLAPLDIDVTTHGDPLTIGAALLDSDPALLLLDAHIPTMDGKAICDLVRRNWPRLPIVLFSSEAPESLRTLMADCGADGFIVKSAQFERIAEEIRRMAGATTDEAP